MKLTVDFYRWVMLTFSWLLTTRCHWTTEAISDHSTKFHLFAWGIPSVQTIAVLATSSVDGDPVGGVCYVGLHSTYNLAIFVVAPLAIYLSIGVVFLFVGLVSMVWIRNAIKLQSGHMDVEKIQRLTVQRWRIGLYAFVTVIPHAALLVCHFYELKYREEWDRSLTCRCQEKPFLPLAIFMIKYLCMLFIGITCLWMFGRKTAESWRKVLCHCCQYNSPSSKYSDIDLIESVHNVSIPRFQKSPYPISNA